jgi:hypothetical protein
LSVFRAAPTCRTLRAVADLFLFILFVTIVRNEWASVGLLWMVVVLLNTLVSGNGLRLLPLTGFECRGFDRSSLPVRLAALRRQCSSCISGLLPNHD